MDVKITIPDAIAPRVLDGMAVAHGWTQESGMNKGQFCKKIVMDFIMASVTGAEGNAAASDAARQARQKAQDEIVLS